MIAEAELRNQNSRPPARELGLGRRCPSHDRNGPQLGYAIDRVFSTDESTLVAVLP
jgi:hypothetical protein